MSSEEQHDQKVSPDSDKVQAPDGEEAKADPEDIPVWPNIEIRSEAEKWSEENVIEETEEKDGV